MAPLEFFAEKHTSRSFYPVTVCRMTSIDLARPRDHLVRRFLIDTELMTDLLIHYPQKTADRQAVPFYSESHLAHLRLV